MSAIVSITENLLKHLGINEAKVTTGEADESLEVNLEVAPEESGVLIGYHGDTISSLQFLLSLMVYHQGGSWQRLVLNINDYRQKRLASLQEMALAAADRAKTTSQEVIMPPMGSFDRRLIHMALSEDKDVHTESVGEGRDRRLIIYPNVQS